MQTVDIGKLIEKQDNPQAVEIEIGRLNAVSEKPLLGNVDSVLTQINHWIWDT